MRIIHCLRAPVGGLFRHVRDLARAQSERGHHVGVICDAVSGDPLTERRLAEMAPSLTLGLERVAMSRDVGLSDLRAVRSVREHAARHAADILHGHGAKGGAYARLAVRSLRAGGQAVAVFYTPHGGSLHYDPATLIGRAYMTAERHLARMTDGIIFESGYSERVFRSKVGQPGCATQVIHNGILPDELVPVIAIDQTADLVFIGELRKLKGIDVLIEAVAALREQRTVSLRIVGAGPDEGELRALVALRGLEPSISFAGAMPAREAFRLGRVLVMPSRAESFPYVALEAAGAGLPLIASDVGGLPEIVAGTDTRLVPPGDAGLLAAAILEALQDPDAARQRAARLHAAVARRFSVATMTDGVLAFYAEAHRRAAA